MLFLVLCELTKHRVLINKCETCFNSTEETDWDEAGTSSYGLPHPAKIDDVLTVR